MRYVLDTCTALWLWADPVRLPEQVRCIIENTGNEIVFHQISTFEIQIKHSLGKLKLPQPPEIFIPAVLRAHYLTYQHLLDDDIFMWRKLPPVHDDPFDRILVSHSLVSGATLLTPDKRIAEYPVRTMWEKKME
jgi:PIN domain nuclease of toxin-antitoxin system